MMISMEIVVSLLKALEAVESLSETEALQKGNEISSKVIEIMKACPTLSQDERQMLYSKAAQGYILASHKVSDDKRSLVEFPSNYWSMRAQQTRFEPK